MKNAPYITPQGFETLKAEYTEIWKRRNNVVTALSAAAAEGDRSENAEYIYRKKELRGLDARIRYLQIRMQELNVVEKVNDFDHVYFGAWVTLEDASGKRMIKRLVGFDDLGLHDDYISIDSPLARSLLNKTVEDFIEYSIENRRISYKISKINY